MTNIIEQMQTTVEPATTAQPATRSRPHLTYLDGLRGAAAMTVGLYHFDKIFWELRGSGAPPHGLGSVLALLAHYAVDVFIVLSGYCLMIPVARSGGFADFRVFVRRRALRILPPYYAALAVSVALALFWPVREQHTGVSAGSVISHLVLLHNLNASWIYDLNGTLWSIATEWQIYFVFALLLIPLHRRIGPAMTALSAFAISAAPWLLIPGFHKVERACFWYIGLFAMGMWAAHENYSPRASNSGRTRNLELAAITVATLAASAIAVRQLSDNAFPAIFSLADGCVGALTALLLYRWNVVARDGRDSAALRFFSSKWLVAFGLFSYSFYLIHSRLLERVIAVSPLRGASLPFSYILTFAVALSVVLVCSRAFYLLFERPFIKLRG
jgi:peptidoglycan/LPS O-acetylase OafA/YrhL